jgi:hypothetical protein
MLSIVKNVGGYDGKYTSYRLSRISRQLSDWKSARRFVFQAWKPKFLDGARPYLFGSCS